MVSNPKNRRIVDLSICLENDVLSDPPPLAPKIVYQSHKETLAEFQQLYPGSQPSDYPDGEAAAAEQLIVTTHNGTHLDAPWHHASTMDARFGAPKRAMTIDEVPLDWCLQPGVKLDFRHFPDGYRVSAADVEAELARIGHSLSPLEIVVINTSAGMAYGQPDYVSKGCGMGREATLYLTERGIRVTGTDGWSWDPPTRSVAELVQKTGDTSRIWEGHKASREIGYCHMEKLHNLESLPATGFTIACFPQKVRGASAGSTRAVAIFEE